MFYSIVKGLMVAIMKPYFRYSVTGHQNVPQAGAVILASNHLSFIDSPLLIVGCKRHINFIGKQAYFETTSAKKKFVNFVMRKMGVFPVNPRGGKGNEAALNKAIEILNEGKVFAIYPEGTRSPDGVLNKGHTGIARISLASGAPIVPVAMIGTFESQPLGSSFPKPKKLRVKYGELIDPKHFADITDAKLRARALTNAVMDQLADLSGQPYDPSTYGQAKRDALRN